ncbi:ATG12 family protein [Megaselia abdita]
MSDSPITEEQPPPSLKREESIASSIPEEHPQPQSLSVQPNSKVDILLNATGNVPIMKKRKWAVDANKPISWIMQFIHKYLKLDPEEQVFLYVNQTFAPSPDQIVRNLFECHGTNGKLVLYYCKNQAWG